MNDKSEDERLKPRIDRITAVDVFLPAHIFTIPILVPVRARFSFSPRPL
jgi:hypothetical protein